MTKIPILQVCVMTRDGFICHYRDFSINELVALGIYVRQYLEDKEVNISIKRYD